MGKGYSSGGKGSYGSSRSGSYKGGSGASNPGYRASSSGARHYTGIAGLANSLAGKGYTATKSFDYGTPYESPLSYGKVHSPKDAYRNVARLTDTYRQFNKAVGSNQKPLSYRIVQALEAYQQRINNADNTTMTAYMMLTGDKKNVNDWLMYQVKNDMVSDYKSDPSKISLDEKDKRQYDVCTRCGRPIPRGGICPCTTEKYSYGNAA